jgi:hypothetical protein
MLHINEINERIHAILPVVMTAGDSDCGLCFFISFWKLVAAVRRNLLPPSLRLKDLIQVCPLK